MAPPTRPGRPASGPGEDTDLTATPEARELLDRKQLEVDQLRTAMRHRAVIEQAKGVLMGWLGVDAEGAFGQLVRYSQHTNRRLSEAAAAVLLHAETRPTSDELRGAVPTVEQLFRVPDALLAERLEDAAIAAAPRLDELLVELREAAGEPVPDGIVLGVLEADGAVRVLATAGYPAATIAGWERIPPRADVPLADAAIGRPILLADTAARIAAYPGSRNQPALYEASASLPIDHQGRRLGVLGLSWATALPFDADHRTRLTHLAQRCGDPLAEHLRAGRSFDGSLPDLLIDPGREHWLQAALDQVPVPIILAEPELEGEGRLLDLTLTYVNPATTAHLADPTAVPLGRSLLALQPWLSGSELWALLRDVVATGTPRRLDHFAVPRSLEGRDDVVIHGLGLARVGNLVLLTWERTEVGAAG